MKDRERGLLSAGIITLLHAPSFGRPLLDSDEAIYASIAALANAGGRLYAEGGVDNKFPGIYLTYAAVFRLFGPYAMTAVHALALLVILATSLVLSRIARRVGATWGAWVAALLYGMLTTFYYPKMLAANTEVFMTLPLALSVLVSLPDRHGKARGLPLLLLSGFLVGIATMYRQLAVLNVLLCAAVAMIGPTRGKGARLARAAAPFLGAAMSLGGLAAIFAIDGNLDDFWFWGITAPATRYLPLGWTYTWPALDLLGMLAVMGIPVGLCLRRARRARVVRTEERVLWLWLGLGLLAILVLWRFHPHYVIHVLPPVVVLAALEVEALVPSAAAILTLSLGRVLVAVLALECLVFFVLALLLEPIAGGLSPPKPDYPRVAEYARSRTHEGDRIFVWGAYAPLYVLSGRLPASRFVGFMRGCPRVPSVPLAKCWDSGPETWPLLAQDLTQTPAELILDTASADYGSFGTYPMKNVPVLADLIAKKYTLETRVDGVDVYRRHE